MLAADRSLDIIPSRRTEAPACPGLPAFYDLTIIIAEGKNSSELATPSREATRNSTDYHGGWELIPRTQRFAVLAHLFVLRSAGAKTRREARTNAQADPPYRRGESTPAQAAPPDPHQNVHPGDTTELTRAAMSLLLV